MKKKGNHPLGPRKIDNTIVSDTGEMSEVARVCLSSMYKYAIKFAHNQHQRTVARMNVLGITYDHFSSALFNFNVFCTSGGDGVPPQVLKSCTGLIAHPLTLLFDRSLRSDDIPSPWKWSVVVQLLKSGSRSSTSNYCRVSLISYKTMDRVVAEEIWDYLEASNLLSGRNFGFRNCCWITVMMQNR